jgi:uncharacterized membrane protein YtjA (UPF0391 family)
MLILWALLFFVIAIVTGIIAFGGVAIAISFFSKFLFLIALVCFLIFLLLIIVQKIKTRPDTKPDDLKE